MTDELGIADRLTAAELKIWREWLRLSQDQLAEILGVKRDTIHRWESGKLGADGTPYRIPDGVRVELDDLIEQADDIVYGLIDSLDNPDMIPFVSIYRTNEELWERHPQVRPFGIESWNQIVARAVSMHDSDEPVKIEYWS